MIHCVIENNIAYVTIDRKEILNVFNFEMLCDLEKVADNLHELDEARVVIFTGAGEKAFSCGADLKERLLLTEEEVRRNVMKISSVFEKIANLPQATISAVNGLAFGGGFELMLATDFRIAVDDTIMGLTEAMWGIIPGGGGTQRLPRLIGETKAKELIFTARKLNSIEALEYGVVNKIVPREDLMTECVRFAGEILRNAPLSIKQAKYAINEGVNLELKEGLLLETKAYEKIIPTRDRIEALEAFKEKRLPQFIGR